MKSESCLGNNLDRNFNSCNANGFDFCSNGFIMQQPMDMKAMPAMACNPDADCGRGGGRDGEQEYRLDGVGRVRMRENGEIEAELFDKAIEVEYKRGNIEIETNRDFGNIKAKIRPEEMKATVRMEGGEIRYKDNRIEIVLGAAKIAATATVLAGVALY